jgi:hypothetical protein
LGGRGKEGGSEGQSERSMEGGSEVQRTQQIAVRWQRARRMGPVNSARREGARDSENAVLADGKESAEWGQ